MTDTPGDHKVEHDRSDDEDNTLYRAPGWFWPVAIAGLLFEGVLAWEYWVEMSSEPVTLDTRAMAAATPLWINVAWALSVWIGVAGAILLALRKGLASAALFVAMVLIGVRYGGLIALPETRGMLTSNELLIPFLTFIATYGLWQAAKIGRRKGWLG